MKRTKNGAIALLLLAAATIGLNAAQKEDGTMTKMADGSYVVNTTTLAKDVKGYRGAIPLKLTIKNDKIEKIEVLKNQETPKYLARVKNEYIPKWLGIKVAKASKLNPDAVTGATLSSNAIKENIKRGLEYYKKNK